MDITYIESTDYENNCAPSVVRQAFLSNCKGILICILINLICSILQLIKSFQFLKDVFISTLNAVAGIYLLLDTFESGTWSILLFAVSAVFVICILKPKSCLLSILGLSAIYVVFNEVHIDPTKWHALRGSFMILLMKIISISIDIDQSNIKTVPIFKLVGYFLTPCSILYGPWFDYRLYDLWSNGSTFSLRSMVLTAKNYCFGMIFLLFSTCGSQLVFSTLPEIKWIKAYQDAQSFRFSHYFISYLSMSYMNSIGIDDGLDISKDTFKYRQIVHPFSIELPRSLIDVVTLWNLPMHFWLKNYVFVPCRRFGKFMAILLTFIASSLLHGFNFALSTILISLGLYSYVEYVLRSQLAKTLNSCIKARPCYGSCAHKFKKYHLISVSINVTFTLFGIFFLAYIAAMLDDSVGHSQGYSMKHSIESWRRLNFSGHILLLIGYLLYFAIKHVTAS